MVSHILRDSSEELRSTSFFKMFFFFTFLITYIRFRDLSSRSRSFRVSQRESKPVTSQSELEFHKFRTLILINPDVALFAYEKIRRKTRAPRGRRTAGNENIVVSTLAYYSRIMIKYIPRRVSSVLRAWVLWEDIFRWISIVDQR